MRVGYFGSGVGLVTPHHWGLLTVTLDNPTQKPHELLAATYLETDMSTQFGRHIWVPPLAQRRTWQLLRLGDVPADARSVPSVALLIDERGAQERMLERKPTPVLIGDDMLATGMIFDVEDDASPNLVIAAADAVRERDNTQLAPRPMPNPPLNALGYDSVGRVIIAKNNPQLEELQIQALRQWLSQGGTIWIMLDQVNPAFPSLLLGSNWPLEEIDRTRLSRVQLPNDQGKITGHLDFEQPVDFVRVISKQAITNPASTYPHDGWPTLITIPYGKGVVFVTTLGSRAWTNQDKPTERLMAAGRLLLRDLKEDGPFFGAKRRTAEQIDAEREVQAATLTSSLIGYKVLDRSWIGGVLGVYCVLFIAAAFVLQRRDKLEWLGLGGLGMAVVFALVMVGVGSIGRESVEATTATATWAEVAPQTGYAKVSGVMDVYTSLLTAGAGSEPLEGREPGSVYWPTIKPKAGATRRLVWTDANHWQWRGLDLPKDATVRGEVSAMVVTGEMPEPTVMPAEGDAIVTLTPWAKAQGLQDMLIVGPGGTGQVLTQGNAGTVAAGDAIDAQTQLLAVSMPEAEAGTLTSMMRDAIQMVQESDAPQSLHLIGLTSQFPVQVEVAGRTSRQLDRSIMTIPVALQRPEAGTRVTLQPWMLAYKLARRGKPGKRGFVSAFDPMNREWLQLSQGGRVNLDFLIPPELGAVRVEAMTFTFDMDASSREVQLFLPDVKSLSNKPVATFNSPTSPQRFEKAELNHIVNNQRFGISLNISDLDDPMSTSTWQIHDLKLKLDVTILEPQNATTDGARP